MAQKRLQKSGENYFLYLPRQWIKANKLTNKDSVDVISDEQMNLIIKPLKGKDEKLIGELNLKNDGIDLILRALISAYLSGYNEFKINLTNKLSNEMILKLRSECDYRGLRIDFDVNKVLLSSDLIIDDLKDSYNKFLSKLSRILMAINVKLPEEVIKDYVKEVNSDSFMIIRSINLALNNVTRLNKYELSVNEASFIKQSCNGLRISINSALRSTNKDLLKHLTELVKILKSSDINKALSHYEELDDKNINEKEAIRSLMGARLALKALIDYLISKK